VIPGLLVVVYIIQHFYLRTSRQLRVRELETKAPLFTKFTETSSGIQQIRAFQWQEAFTLKMQAALDYSLIPYYTLFCVQRWLTLVLDLITCAVATMLVTLALEYRRETSDNALGLSMLSVVTFSGSLGSLLESWTELEISLGAIARLKMFCFGTPQERDDDKAQHIPEHWPSTGRIEFRGVSASYM
jgi:ABC-type multidrug transport system fused ATPase/permease subunit